MRIRFLNALYTPRYTWLDQAADLTSPCGVNAGPFSCLLLSVEQLTVRRQCCKSVNGCKSGHRSIDHELHES